MGYLELRLQYAIMELTEHESIQVSNFVIDMEERKTNHLYQLTTATNYGDTVNNRDAWEYYVSGLYDGIAPLEILNKRLYKVLELITMFTDDNFGELHTKVVNKLGFSITELLGGN